MWEVTGSYRFLVRMPIHNKVELLATNGFGTTRRRDSFSKTYRQETLGEKTDALYLYVGGKN